MCRSNSKIDFKLPDYPCSIVHSIKAGKSAEFQKLDRAGHRSAFGTKLPNRLTWHDSVAIRSLTDTKRTLTPKAAAERSEVQPRRGDAALIC